MTEGLLQEIPLDGVIQLVTLGGGTGELELVPLLPPHQAGSRVPVGHLFFREGALHAAFLAERGGEAVMKTLFLWEAGFFTWTPRDAQSIPPANIMQDTSLVILSGFKHHETWTQAREVIPTLRVVLCRPSSPLPGPPGPLPETHTLDAQVLALCDGQTQLAQISERLGGGRIACRFAAARLVVAGLLAVKPLTMGEKLARSVAITAHPLLGVAGEIFCDAALQRTGIDPATLAQPQKLRIGQVAQVVSEMGGDVAAVLGAQRARDMTEQLGTALGVASYQTNEGGIHHV
ncbi:MAG: DUF4388 domain-containing protein [Ktedonobacterales bacterium]|nr:DUF4388 domain-containing protein [Ktedonobacterales bacterium]